MKCIKCDKETRSVYSYYCDRHWELIRDRLRKRSDKKLAKEAKR